ncbi:hypothetical protein CEXT_371591 [Caerostris extrusa]|uniref:Secreted protein n=1 Tax=Caerostris extrusa TaxID=172846 RepID=A0AAV4PS54_CAEEX|nr:hypothetical protein CEXT_371591 [Caerostris extrusa]
MCNYSSLHKFSWLSSVVVSLAPASHNICSGVTQLEQISFGIPFSIHEDTQIECLCDTPVWKRVFEACNRVLCHGL